MNIPPPYNPPTRFDRATQYVRNTSSFGFPWTASRDGVTGQGFTQSEALMDLELRIAYQVRGEI